MRYKLEKIARQSLSEGEHRDPRLTPREIQVLRVLCEPCSTKEAAARLGITYKTAVSHRTHIMEKSGTHDPISLFRWGVREGYIPPEVPNGGVEPENAFSYACTVCKPKQQDGKAIVFVMIRCPKHGLCWHHRECSKISFSKERKLK